MSSDSRKQPAARRGNWGGGGQGWRVAAVVVALAGWLLPAFRLTTPITPPRQWHTWELVAEAAGAGPRQQVWPGADIAQLAELDRQYRHLAENGDIQAARADGGGWKWRAVEAIPIAIVIAAWAAVAAAIALGWRRGGWALGAAVVGAIAAAYALGVSKIATLVARDELRAALAAAKRHFPLAGLLHVQIQGLALATGPGVLVMLAAFVGLLLLGRGDAAGTDRKRRVPA